MELIEQRVLCLNKRIPFISGSYESLSISSNCFSVVRDNQFILYIAFSVLSTLGLKTFEYAWQCAAGLQENKIELKNTAVETMMIFFIFYLSVK